MVSIRRVFRILVICLLLPGPVLYGQYAPQSGSSSFDAELQSIEKTLTNPGLSTAGRRQALSRRGRLLGLAGDLEGAAGAWLEAAFADTENWDDGSLLEGARCFIALGELDKAETHIKTVLLTGKDPGFLRQARYLGAYIESFRAGNGQAFIALMEDPEYRDQKPAMLYTLWYLSGSESYKGRLLGEFPASPEARLLRGDRAGIRPSAFWLLYSGREGVYMAEPKPVAPPAAPPADIGGRAAVLQTGLFGREENAQATAARLRNMGFSGTVSSRVINGTVYWAVTVPSGNDMRETILRLKNAGFESFPIF